jgi:CHAT domain-containing protein/tetratricopeptide (TPR) repeat protein
MASSASEAARRWIDEARGELPTLLPAPAAALAQALKDEAMAAWGTTPALALRCAALLGQLRGRDDAAEVGAMADWAAGLASLTQGRLADAAWQFDAAHDSLLALGRAHEAAQTRVPKLIVLSMLGRHDEALACGEAALAAFVAAGDEGSAGKIELNLGTLHSRRDCHAEAVALYRRASVRAARAGDRELSIRADISLANGLSWQYDFDEALRVFERALMRSRTHGHAVLAAQARGGIGRIELLRGGYARALRELAAARAGLAEVGASPQQCIDAELSLADAYQAVNLLPEAQQLYASVIRDAAAIEASTEQATALLEAARVAHKLGDAASALAGFEQARALFEAEGNTTSVAWADLSVAALQLERGEAEAARIRAADAAQRLAEAGIRGWALEGRALAAAAAAAMGALDAARTQFTRTLAEADGLGPVQWACHRGLGELAWQAGDTLTARHHAGLALQGLDETRAALPGDGFRTAFGADAEALHDRLVRIAWARREPAIELLETIERGRARALVLAVGEVHGGGTASAEATALQWLRERRREALADGDADAVAALGAEEAQREQALLEAARRAQLAQDANGAPGATATTSPWRAAALPESLGAAQAVVAFHASGAHWLACVASDAGVQAVELDASGVDARLRSLRLQLDALRLGGMQRLQGEHGERLLQRVRSHLQALHTMLWAPLAGALGGRRRVVVVPHGPLHYLPFAALHDGAQWLVEAHDLSLAPSVAWAEQALAAPATPPQRVLALGFGGGVLAHVDEEAAAVGTAFGAGARVLVGAQATREALRSAAGEADVVHLACHAQFRADSPMFSALELADGALALHEAPQLGLRAQLVTLSACETGLSRLAPGNEAIGLVRGFLMSGVRTVVASSWAVDDAATATLMRGFYRRLVGGEACAEALAGAQRESARGGAHPFHWAAFAPHGRG